MFENSFYRIENVKKIYRTANLSPQCDFLWQSTILKIYQPYAGESGWGEWEPRNGTIGKIVLSDWRMIGKRRDVLLKVWEDQQTATFRIVPIPFYALKKL